MRTALLVLVLVTVTSLVTAPVSAASPAAVRPAALIQVSSDPFTNSGTYHATEVEPDTYAVGSTIVGTFQAGRSANGGSSDIGWAASRDAGRHWSRGFLPDTVYSRGRYARISDPAVGYDRKYRTWLISGLAISSSGIGTGVVVNRSADALHWSKPVTAYAVAAGGFVDKDWITCDNTPSSRYYGNCYAEFDIVTAASLLEMSVSSDGGRTWRAPKHTPDGARGIGGQPVVQPDGRVVVPYFGTAVARGRAFALVAVGLPAAGRKAFSEPMMVVPGGEPVAGGTHAVQAAVSGTAAAGRVPAVPPPPRP